MRLGLIQYSISDHALDNVSLIQRELSGVADATIVLPEMFLGRWNQDGFDAQHEHALETLVELCMAQRLILLGSTIEHIDSDKKPNAYNTLWRIDATGARPLYRKIHLFHSLNEHHRYAPGQQAVVTTIGGIRFGLAVCYDLRFGTIFTALRQARADVIVVPARWPVPRIDHWRTLLKSRAIEFQTYVVGVNCLGRDRFGETEVEYTGQSRLVSPWGEVLIEADDAPGLAMTQIDAANVTEARSRLAVWDDRMVIGKAIDDD